MAALLALDFNNGRIMFVLEHMPAHSQSAAEHFGAKELKTDHNSLVGKELNWRKKMTSKKFL